MRNLAQGINVLPLALLSATLLLIAIVAWWQSRDRKRAVLVAPSPMKRTSPQLVSVVPTGPAPAPKDEAVHLDPPLLPVFFGEGTRPGLPEKKRKIRHIGGLPTMTPEEADLISALREETPGRMAAAGPPIPPPPIRDGEPEAIPEPIVSGPLSEKALQVARAQKRIRKDTRPMPKDLASGLALASMAGDDSRTRRLAETLTSMRWS